MPSPFVRFINQVSYFIPVGHVTVKCDGTSSCRALHIVSSPATGFEVTANHDYVCACLGECQDHRPAETAATSSDERYLAGQIKGVAGSHLLPPCATSASGFIR